MVPLWTWHPLCSRADSKKPSPWILESMHGGAKWMIISLNVSKPSSWCESSTKKLNLLFLSAIFLMTCFRVWLLLLVTGASILGENPFFKWRNPADRRAPRSRSMVGSEPILLGSMWMNSPTVRVLQLQYIYIYKHQIKHAPVMIFSFPQVHYLMNGCIKQ